LLGAVSIHLAAAWAKQKRRPLPSWADRCLARLEQAGEAAGRPRRSSETVYEYACALEQVSSSSEHLGRMAALVSRDAFSGQALADEDRQWVERMLDDVARLLVVREP
jgi:Domain of unknown function (DUF4129)